MENQNITKDPINIDEAINITTGTLKYQKILVLVLGLGFSSLNLIAVDQVFYLPRERNSKDENDATYEIGGTFGGILGLDYLGSSRISFLFGVLVGSIFIVSYLADRYGRKVIIEKFGILGIISMIFTALSTNMLMMYISAFVNGLAFVGLCLTGIVLCVESIDFKHRELYVGIFMVIPQVWIIITIILLRSVIYWRYVILISSVPLLLELYLLTYVQESPRFLLSNAFDIEGCTKALNKISLMNGEGNFTYSLISENTKRSPFSIREIFYSRMLVVRLVTCGVMWFNLLFIYYSMIFLMIGFGELYLRAIISSIALILSSLASVPLINTYGRKKLTVIGLASTGILFVIMTVVKVFNEGSNVVIILSLVLRLLIGGMLNLLSLYTAEQFPTYLRCTCFGISNGIGRIGAISAAVITSLPAGNALTICSIIAGIMILASPSVIYLEETHHKELDEMAENPSEQLLLGNKQAYLKK